MLQGSDPFDEFRMKKEIARLEGDFRESADRKRKRLKELLEGDDGGDPDGIQKRVQAEMESFFRESATAAESIFAGVGAEGEVCHQEILDRLDEVLQPVERGTTATLEGRRSAEDPDGDGAEEHVQEALARLRGLVGRDGGAEPEGGAVAVPDWLDVTEETIDESDRSSEGKDQDDRRRRILGAFDESAVRFRDLIREGLSESAMQSAIDSDEPNDDAAEPPLTPRAEPGGYVASTRPRTLTEPAQEPAPVSMQARLEVLEEEVARLRRALERNGLLEDETA
jgi:hypothetical protein